MVLILQVRKLTRERLSDLPKVTQGISGGALISDLRMDGFITFWLCMHTLLVSRPTHLALSSPKLHAA